MMGSWRSFGRESRENRGTGNRRHSPRPRRRRRRAVALLRFASVAMRGCAFLLRRALHVPITYFLLSTDYLHNNRIHMHARTRMYASIRRQQ